MEGTIFIRGNQITEQEEEILAKFKERKSISANTKAIQSIITEYGRLEKSESDLLKKNKDQRDKIWELENQIEEYQKFFQLFNKLNKSSKK